MSREADMRITSSNVTLASSQISFSTSTVHEHLRMWGTDSELTYTSDQAKRRITAGSFLKKDSVDISRPAARMSPKKTPLPDASVNCRAKQPLDEKFIGDIKVQIIKDIIEMFTGRKIKVFNPRNLEEQEAIDPPPPDNRGNGSQPTELEGWGIDYQYRRTNWTKEGVVFSAEGSVSTADGRAISFTTALEMSRETYEEVNISLKAGDALKDPLVIDLAGNGAAFSAVEFEFDIDADGTNELLFTPLSGTAFLAYDKNGNGIIDNGRELFGPESGDGFSELAMLDEDHDGWIDESDSSFSRLRVWEKNADGADIISPLLQRNIGALHTGSARTDYSITTTGNELAGVLRENGIYLKENGGAGVIQEIDLVV